MMKASKYSRRSMTFLCDFNRASSGLSNVLLAFGQKAFRIQYSDAFSRKQVHFRRSCNRNAFDELHVVLSFSHARQFGNDPTVQIECHVHFTVSFTFIFHCLEVCARKKRSNIRSSDLLVDDLRLVFSY